MLPARREGSNMDGGREWNGNMLSETPQTGQENK